MHETLELQRSPLGSCAYPVIMNQRKKEVKFKLFFLQFSKIEKNISLSMRINISMDIHMWSMYMCT